VLPQTREGDRLVLGGSPFRFVSFNMPDLHVVEDGTWHRVTPWEQEDGLLTVARLGGQVSVSGACLGMHSPTPRLLTHLWRGRLAGGTDLSHVGGGRVDERHVHAH
jgi:hypothetical protein